jgi:hypothetical protein
VIVLTNSRITRGVVTVFNWLGVNIGAYLWARLKAALKSFEDDPKVEFYLDDYCGEIGTMCEWYHRTLALDAPLML